MSVRCEQYNGACVIAIDGDLSGPAVQDLRQAVERYAGATPVTDFVLDMEKCAFLDSEGLEALLWVKQTAEDRFGQLKLAHLDETCRKILQITRLEHRFDCHADLAGALKTLR